MNLTPTGALRTSLWRHRSLEVRLQNLEERHLRLQHQVGRIIETMASWDHTVATMFGLATPPSTNPTGGSSSHGGAGSRGAAGRVEDAEPETGATSGT